MADAPRKRVVRRKKVSTADAGTGQAMAMAASPQPPSPTDPPRSRLVKRKAAHTLLTIGEEEGGQPPPPTTTPEALLPQKPKRVRVKVPALASPDTPAADGGGEAPPRVRKVVRIASPPSTVEMPTEVPKEEGASFGQRALVDRPTFASPNFSAPQVVNALTQRIVHDAMQQLEREAKRGLTHHTAEEMGSREPSQAAEHGGDELADYRLVAAELCAVLGDASTAVAELLVEEERGVQEAEVRCKRVEKHHKHHLATIRLGLESTSARLQEFEYRVTNAQATTAGIEQHLLRSNTRAQRGKVIGQLLRFYEMFRQLKPGELAEHLKALSAVRTTQREASTRRWQQSANLSSASPNYFANLTAAVDDASNDGGTSPRREDEGAANVSGGRVPLTATEAAAVRAGLDPLFVSRSCTEAQVEWCQRLTMLTKGLGDSAAREGSVGVYVKWLTTELVKELFHVTANFNEFYQTEPRAAVHLPRGRACLRTLELLSRLYSTISSSSDNLLTAFFNASIDQLAVSFLGSFSPNAPPPQPPLPAPSTVMMMDYFKEKMEPMLGEAFRYVMHIIRREAIVVETIFGMASTARQQLLHRSTERVVKRYIAHHTNSARAMLEDLLKQEAALSPRATRRSSRRVADAMAYYHAISARLFIFFQDYVQELCTIFEDSEVEFLNQYSESIFDQRPAYTTKRWESALLQRCLTQIDEKYTRHLHPIPGEAFDIRDAHMTKSKEMLQAFIDAARRICVYGMPKDVANYLRELIQLTYTAVGGFLNEELRKTEDSLRADMANWRVRPKSEEELLRPSKTESQHCGFRLLLFVQSTLMNVGDCVNSIVLPLLPRKPQLAGEVEEVRTKALEALDDRAERVLNWCIQAVVSRSLSILLHYQGKNDYCPRAGAAGTDSEMVAPPCTRACTLFCYYLTRQWAEAKEFLRLSNGQLPRKMEGRPTEGESSSGGLQSVDSITFDDQSVAISMMAVGRSVAEAERAVRARARTMNMNQLLYGDGGPSSVVRTLGVCLYRGISAHLKSFVANDRGALIYKQDVMAYKEAMGPLTITPGLGGAVVEVLFQVLRETGSLLIMPLDNIKEVKQSGSLRLLSNEEKMAYLRIRQDVRDALKVMGK